VCAHSDHSFAVPQLWIDAQLCLMLRSSDRRGAQSGEKGQSEAQLILTARLPLTVAHAQKTSRLRGCTKDVTSKCVPFFRHDSDSTRWVHMVPETVTRSQHKSSNLLKRDWGRGWAKMSGKGNTSPQIRIIITFCFEDC
jgi:hypothetical protein